MRRSPKKPRRHVPTIDDLRTAILLVTRKHGAKNVRIFGSFARNEQRASSDIDLLVTFPDHFTLMDHAGLKIELEEAVGRSVDVVSDRSIKTLLRPYILADARPL